MFWYFTQCFNNYLIILTFKWCAVSAFLTSSWLTNYNTCCSTLSLLCLILSVPNHTCACSISTFQILVNLFVFFHINMVILGYHEIHIIRFPCVFLLDCYVWSVVSDFPSISTCHSISTFLVHAGFIFCCILSHVLFHIIFLSLHNCLLYALLIYLLSGISCNFGDISCLSIMYLIQFAYKAWLWAADMITSVPFFIYLIFSHFHDLFLLLLWYFS